MRIRSIKPAFWRSLTLARLPREIRLFFVGLWNYVDDEGRGLAEPRLIKGDLFSLDDDVTPELVATWLRRLAEASLILLYQDDRGRFLLAVRSFAEHQRVDKPRQSELATPPAVSAVLDVSMMLPRTIPDASGLEVDRDREVDREQGEGSGADSTTPAREAFDVSGFTGLSPEGQTALTALVRASGNPTALLAELGMIRDGARGPAPTLAELSLALVDLAANPPRGPGVSLAYIRRFVQRAVTEARSGPPAVTRDPRYAGSVLELADRLQREAGTA